MKQKKTKFFTKLPTEYNPSATIMADVRDLPDYVRNSFPKHVNYFQCTRRFFDEQTREVKDDLAAGVHIR